jgi:predicted TIM-barrel fold metal-dependent hydrolase
MTVNVDEFRDFDLLSAEQRALASVEPMMIVSADSHWQPLPETFLPYLESRYHDQFDAYLEDMAIWYRAIDAMRFYTADALKTFDTRRAIRDGGQLGYFDPNRRLRETLAEGVVAEIIHPAGVPGSPPFIRSVGLPPFSPELRAAGARAYNRALDDFCSAAPDQLHPVHLIYPWPDAVGAAKACKKAREAGAKAIFTALTAGVPGDACPPLYDPFWDPLWAACQELELPIHIHAGFGRPDGEVGRVFAEVLDSDQIAELFETFVERRPLWQLMWGGVFYRFPRLRVCFTELHVDWIPGTLKYLDDLYMHEGGPMEKRPSEYWQQNCAAGLSLMRYGDVEARHQIGLEKVMFGTDYPHPEGTWPNTWDWIRTTLGKVPETEVRLILGENAAKYYGMDLDRLKVMAKRHGPAPSQLLGEHNVDSALIAKFNERGGILKPANLNSEQLMEAVRADVTGALSFHS